MKHEKAFVVASPSLSFSLSSFLLFLLEDLLWEDWEVPVCPALLPPPENDEEEEEELASTLLPHRAQESSCKSTGETPSSTRKLTWSRKYNTAGRRREQTTRGERKDTNNVYNSGLKNVLAFTKTDLNHLTVILHAELLPVDCPLCGNLSTSFQVFHLKQEKHVTLKQSDKNLNT